MSSPNVGAPRLVRTDRVSATELARIRDLISAATEADGVAPLDEAAMLELGNGTYLLAVDPEDATTNENAPPGQATGGRATDPALGPDDGRDSGRIAGFARLVRDGAFRAGDLVVHPDRRRRGIGTALLAEALRLTGNATPPAPLRLWAHGPHPAAAPLAAAYGLRTVRELWRMQRPLGPGAPPLPEPSLPPEASHVRIRTFRPGQDEEAWLRANATAFADHPEQGRMTRADLDERMTQPWFSPAGFFVAERIDEPGRIVGFHWTKVHPASAGKAAVGEIYVLGVAEPTRGLGTALALTGLRHLAGLGLGTTLLFTEGDNDRAIDLYRKLGFEHAASDVMYASDADDARSRA